GFNDGSVSVVDLPTNTVRQVVHVSRTNAYRLALSKDESRLYITSANGHLYTMNTASHVVTDSVSLLVFDGLTLDHAGTTLYATASGTVWRIDAPGLTTARQASLGCAARDVALATDDSEVYVACEDGSIAVLDPSSLSTKAVISPPGAAPFGLAVSPDNAQLYVASSLTHTLTIIDRATRTVVKTPCSPARRAASCSTSSAPKPTSRTKATGSTSSSDALRCVRARAHGAVYRPAR